ncbi:MAG: response regulator [Acidobacteria bacterium]|nr:response regulator [Acidobacteriota bacterium]MBV9625951.1 response regulator [Acidobacteriota bacterium]
MPTILLIDDSRFMRMVNERALSRAGYKVIGTEDGQKGLELAKQHRPDLILLDMLLPKMPGPEVLRQLKSDPQTSPIPVIVLTSLSEKNKEKLVRDGALDLLEKNDALLARECALLVEAVRKAVGRAAGMGK